MDHIICQADNQSIPNYFAWALFKFIQFSWCFFLPPWATFCHSFSHFFLRLSAASLIRLYRIEEGKRGKWLLNCILKFYESRMPRDNIGCQSGLPVKESFVSPSKWFYVVTFSFTPFFFHPLSLPVMSVSGVLQAVS